MDTAAPPVGLFAERLLRVLDDRKPTPWAQRLRISPGTRARMFSGIPPTHEALARIMHVENVSLSWLLGANVAPYLVARTADDAETAEMLRAHFADTDGWRITHLVGGDRRAWLLTDPGSIADARGDVHYTAIEVIAGPSGAAAFDAWQKAHPGTSLSVRDIGDNFMHLLYSGLLGTYQLVGDDTTQGLVDPYAEYNEAQPLPPTSWSVRESAAGDVTDLRTRLQSTWPKLDDHERGALQVILDPFLTVAETRED